MAVSPEERMQLLDDALEQLKSHMADLDSERLASKPGAVETPEDAPESADEATGDEGEDVEILCPHCGAEIDAGAGECPKCEGAIEQEKPEGAEEE